jgi:hypothetical protein
MVLTLNYADLQNIKQQIITDKITDNDKIYNFIQCYKDTLSYMYKNNLNPDKSRTDYEYELMNFANDMLKNTDKSFKELEREYKFKTTKDYLINPNDIRLIL